MKIFIVTIIAGLLAACSQSPQQLAAQGNWYQVGYQDGIKGHTQRTQSNLQSLGEGNQGEYYQGYLDGVNEYCDPDVAYQVGFSGQYYQGVCEGTPIAQKFRMEWQRGWNDFNH